PPAFLDRGRVEAAVDARRQRVKDLANGTHRGTREGQRKKAKGKSKSRGASYFFLLPFSFGLVLLFQDFLRLLIRQFTDLVFLPLEQRLHFFLALVAFVLGHLLGLLRGIKGLVGIAADVAAGHLGVLGRLLDARRHLLPLLAGHWR